MKDEIKELLVSKKFKEAKMFLSDKQIVDIADNIKDLEIDEIAQIMRLLNKDMAAELFSELPLSVETELLSKLTDKEAVLIINEMFADDANTPVGNVLAFKTMPNETIFCAYRTFYFENPC